VKEGDVVLTPVPQADGGLKNRPALLLRQLPPFGDYLVCGISTQIHQAVPDFDEIIRRSDDDFAASRLVTDSVVRLGYLAVVPRSRIVGAIGRVSTQRHERLLKRLSRYLVAGLGP
jgi:mRNA interferase MazF